jgi:hypothetical protein
MLTASFCPVMLTDSPSASSVPKISALPCTSYAPIQHRHCHVSIVGATVVGGQTATQGDEPPLTFTETGVSGSTSTRSSCPYRHRESDECERQNTKVLRRNVINSVRKEPKADFCKCNGTITKNFRKNTRRSYILAVGGPQKAAPLNLTSAMRYFLPIATLSSFNPPHTRTI